MSLLRTRSSGCWSFHEYHFIDTEPARSQQLRDIAGDRKNVYTYTEDCNTVLLRDVFPRAKHRDYRRALCLLDPYNIDLTWQVIEAAGQSGSVDMFLNFMDHGHQQERVAQAGGEVPAEQGRPVDPAGRG